MAPPSSSTTRTHRPRKLGSRILLTLIVVGGLAFILLFFLVAFGQVEGQEFSPDSLALRRFSYMQLPLVNIQVTPPTRTTLPSPLTKYLRQQRFDRNGKQAATTRWDVVYAVGSRLNYRGDADIVRQYLVSKNDDGDNPWVVWSEENPKLARVIWPEVVQAIRQRHYVLLPRMLELAESAGSRDELRDALATLQRESEGWLAELDAATP
jgi:hypothetical protein